MILSIIAAVAANGAIGNKGDLIYRLPSDLVRFKKLTTAHSVIMGRKTFESLPNGPLPNRKNIVITSRNLGRDDIVCAESIEDAVIKANACEPDEEIFIIGGASVYSEMLKRDLIDKIYLTEIGDTPEEADAFFPEIPDSFDVTWAEYHEKDERNKYDFSFVNYEKISRFRKNQ